ncbi:MAG: hypothetical protein AAGH43_13595 [Pseudomonadota bacterium]
MTYRLASTLTGTLAAQLCLCLLVVPDLVHWLFALTPGDASEVIGRRAAMLFAGVAVVLFLTRDHPPSPTRRAIGWGVVAMMGGLAAIGMVEFWRGLVGPGIGVAIVTELAVVFAFVRANARS